MRTYDPRNWYWSVAGRDDFYSSASAGFVVEGDAALAAWLAADGHPTRIESEAALGEVLHHAGRFDPALPYTPDEVPMHKIEKAAKLTEWPGHANLYQAILWGISQLPPPSDSLALTEFNRAANLVRLGATTLAVMQLLGMADEQRDELMRFAQSLP